MKAQRSHLSVLIFVISFIVFSVQLAFAQTDLELYNTYVQENEVSSNFASRYESQYAEPDYKDILLQSDDYQTLIS
jgi:hypothetical protein